MEITTQSLTSVKRGLQKIFDAAYHGATDLWWKLLVLGTTSKAGEEEYHWLGSVPGLKKLLGEVTIQNLVRHGYTIKNDEFHDTVAILRRDIERDALGVYTPLVQLMAEAASQHPGELLAQLLTDGFSTSDYTGTAFFAATKKAHAKARAFGNKGTKKLSAANYQLARANLVGRLNAEGRAMRLGKKLVLMVSPTYESLAKQILLADEINGTTNMDKGTATVMCVPELLAANAEHNWFLVETGSAMKAFISQTEVAPRTAMCTDPDDSHVIKTGEFIYQVNARHNVGYGLPELAYGSTGADAA